ncbi:MAG TPA: GYF domain-containing protein [Chthoniobacteraceae bacterium]|nr:GYF domain-containing protein [Chthoniobacteraceae bacterium]
MQIYIHRNNEDFGPYSKETLLEYLKQGVFQTYDYACYQGMSEWKTVSELLGINAPANSAKGAKSKSLGGGVAIASGGTTRSLGVSQQGLVRRRPAAPPKKRTGMIVINLILAALLGAGIYLRMGGGGEQGARLMAKIRGMLMGGASPAPAPAQDSAPAPMIAPATATAPSPETSSIPVATVAAPTPVPMPSTIHITAPVKFPAVMDGKIVGSVSVPQGTQVNLVRADGDQLIINYQGGMVRIARNLTDIDSASAASQPAKAPAIAPAAPAAAAPSSPPAAAPAAGGN